LIEIVEALKYRNRNGYSACEKIPKIAFSLAAMYNFINGKMG